MPPKSKKHSKTPSSRPPQSPSQQQQQEDSSSSSSSHHQQDITIALCLQQASAKYPLLLGKSALVGQLSDVADPAAQFRGCRIWVSESSLVSSSSSLAPGSVVSVSIAALEGGGLESSSPLREFEEDVTVPQAGNYFALATVFPSSKVSKGGVRLSSNLSHTMGCPAPGSIVFVYPIQTHLLYGIGSANSKPRNTMVESLSLHDCGELYLELVPNKNHADYVGMKSDMMFKRNFPAGKSQEQSENGTVSSPRTPLCKLKLSSSSPSHLASSRCEEVTSNLSNNNGKDAYSFDIQELLKDESAKQLLQACATSWLHSRILIRGNIVTIPIHSKLCSFRVINLNQLPVDCVDQDFMKEESLHPEAPEFNDHVKDAFLINHETNVYLSLPQRGGFPSLRITHGHKITLEGHDQPKLGGLSKEYAVLKDIIVSSMKNTLSSVGLRPTKGVLLHGPPGTGKTSLARLCVIDAGVRLFSINGPEIVRQYHGESEQAMHEVFDSACQAAPAVVFIDDLDAIAPARRYGSEELSQRMVATLLNLMDGICQTEGVLVIAATNRPDSIEPALRRPGRLDREIEIGVPSPRQRFDILLTLLKGRQSTIPEVQIEELSKATHGFVGADLVALCNEAALVCLRRNAESRAMGDNFNCSGSSISHEVASSEHALAGSDCSISMGDGLWNQADSESSGISGFPSASSSCNGTVSEVADNMENDISFSRGKHFLDKLEVSFEDFEKARMKVRPSAMREVMLEIPKVKWEDVGGQKEVKSQLMEAVEWPQRHQDAFKRIGTRPPTGILLFGPPGCSKTLMARAVASEAGLNFLAVKGPELFSKWVGESEKAVKSLFEKARANAPSIIFFDEIDGLAVIRGKENGEVSVSDRVISQLLVELDGLHQRVNVTVIAATNRPDKIDPALLRPGRFDRLLYVGPPNENDREEIFRIHLRKTRCGSDVNAKELASLTDACTGADISAICRNAALLVIEENKEALEAGENIDPLERRKAIDALEVKMKHLRNAIGQVHPAEVHSHRELSAKFQRLVHSEYEDRVEYQQCSSGSTWHPIWTFVKSFWHFFFSFSGSKAS
ncbi:hypothetical protein Tsubulata_026095 [Turnera subulata]|uniref:AAA+ ATPase domain-containing protein n=1 Tax=Turnera subulata TaxID=218843 RepID=A0A9Q0IXW6_9ROSI|nr:hypothetical protein Tsubulata_026095 [Turnera subulata]